MTTINVQVKGIPKLKQALDGNLRLALSRATLGIAEQIRGRMIRYPKRGPGNIPGQRRWYQRGWGPKWRSNPKYRPKNRRGGKYPITYGSDWAGYNISESLKHSWGVERKWSIAGANTGAIVGSKASYSPVVHHYQEQASVHERTGWKTDKEVVDQLVRSGAVDRIVNQAVKRILKG